MPHRHFDLFDNTTVSAVDGPPHYISKMIAPLDDVTARALSLPVAERAQLIKRLLLTIEDSQEQVETAWSAEIARRVTEAESGTASLISADQVMEEARARVKAAAHR